MLRHVIAPSSGWTKAPNVVVRDRRMNSDAKVLLLYVQGLPDSATDRPLSELALKLDLKGRSYQQAKKQLVEHGFLHEWRAQGDGGRWATDQLLTNTPLTRDEARAVRVGLSPDAGEPTRTDPPSPPPSAQSPAVGRPTPRSVGGYVPEEDHNDETTSHPPSEAERQQGGRQGRQRGRLQRQQPRPGPGPGPQSPPRPEPGADQERPPTPVRDGAEPGESALPRPHHAPIPAQLVRAEKTLLSLRHSRRDLLLGVGEARALAREAVTWLERGLTESDLRQALLAEPPEGGVRSAFGFLRHRLARKCPLPPASAPAPTGLPAQQPSPVRELLVCAGEGAEEHLFRPRGEETECADCRRATAYGTWMVDTDTCEFPAGMSWRQRVVAVRTADALREAARGAEDRRDEDGGDRRRGEEGGGGRDGGDHGRGSAQRDAGGDGEMVAAGGGQGADIADDGGTGHDLVDPGEREGSRETEGETPLGHAQL